jgi:hypothetical protein
MSPFGVFTDGRAPDQLRGVLALALQDRGMVLERVSVDDAGGGVTQTWGTADVNVPCRITPLGGPGRGLTGDRIDERSTHTVTTPARTGVPATGRFVIDGRGTYEVTAVRERTNERTCVFEVLRVD